MITKIGVASLVAVFLGGAAFAALPRNAVTGIVVNAYGVYTTDDPTCRERLIPTIPLTATPVTVDMLSKPDMGRGRVANPIACIVMVMKNQIEMKWAAGNYTSTTTVGGTTGSDSVCNTASSDKVVVCKAQGGQPGQVITWPTQVQTDMNDLGLTMTTRCPTTATGNEIFVVYLSTYSACYVNSAFDKGNNSCFAQDGVSPSSNTFGPPTRDGDTANGIKLIPPSTASNYALVVDPDQTIGNESGACKSTGPPRFSFRKD